MSDDRVRAGDLPPDQVTLAELVRWLGRVERDAEKRSRDLERQVEGLKYVTTDRYDPEQKELLRRLERVEADVNWNRRVQVTTMLTVLASTAVLYLQAAGTL